MTFKFLDGNSYSLEIEKSLLSIFMKEPELRGLITYKVNKDHFFDPQHQFLYDIMQKLYNTNNKFDIIILGEQIKNSGLIKYLKDEILKQPYNIDNIDFYISNLTDKYLLRESYKIAYNFCKQIEKGDKIQSDIISRVTSELITLSQEKNFDVDIGNIIDEFKKSFEIQKKKDNDIFGYSTGIKKLDKLINGIKPGELTIIGGQTSLGKSSFGINIALNAVKNDISVLFLSLEMRKIDILHRMLSIISGIPLTTIQLAKTSAKDETQIKNILEKLKKSKIFIYDKILTINKLISLIRTLHAQKGIQVVILDYIQFIANLRCLEDYILLTRSLSQVSKELNIAVIAMSQLSRYVERRDELSKKPRLSDLRASGSLEEDCGTAMLLYYPYRFTKKRGEEDKLWILVEKNRRGQTGEIQLRFDKITQRIDDGISNKNIFKEWSKDVLKELDQSPTIPDQVYGII